jgi:hypothetical protein
LYRLAPATASFFYFLNKVAWMMRKDDLIIHTRGGPALTH